MNFNDILELLRSNSINESEKGTKFERLIKNWFLTAPLYRDQVKQVWLWSDFPYRKSFHPSQKVICLFRCGPRCKRIRQVQGRQGPYVQTRLESRKTYSPYDCDKQSDGKKGH